MVIGLRIFRHSFSPTLSTGLSCIEADRFISNMVAGEKPLSSDAE
jgi:hypothetical protein